MQSSSQIAQKPMSGQQIQTREFCNLLDNWRDAEYFQIQKRLNAFSTQIQSFYNNQYGTLPGFGFAVPSRLVDITQIQTYIPSCLTLDDLPEEVYQSSWREVEVLDGLPCVDGVPLWERLDGERVDYYSIFKIYREQPYQTLFDRRTLAKLCDQTAISGTHLAVLSQLYHWQTRVKCYDLYKEQTQLLVRRKEAELLESRHSSIASDLLDQAMSVLDQNRNEISPKVAIEMIELGMKYGRISVGLLGDKPGTQQTVAHQTNIAIQNSSTQSETLNSVNVIQGNANGVVQGSRAGQSGATSEIERKFAESLQDRKGIVSILNVLNRSGAFTSDLMDTKDVIDERNDPEAYHERLLNDCDGFDDDDNAGASPELVDIDDVSSVIEGGLVTPEQIKAYHKSVQNAQASVPAYLLEQVEREKQNTTKTDSAKASNNLWFQKNASPSEE